MRRCTAIFFVLIYIRVSRRVVFNPSWVGVSRVFGPDLVFIKLSRVGEKGTVLAKLAEIPSFYT